ncbi:unnamed protein product [Cylindrotheca closterium]|uniref:Uncharacterized protein n=1 Tax=Cylindrotheca closterium TaxID=2856 RepID=A0AAD2FQ86_9STRA|nr:unnamed protein product [Cylindrotheca closterium]
MHFIHLTIVLMALLASPVVAKDKTKKKHKEPVRVALLMPEDLRNVVTIETSHNAGSEDHGDDTRLGHYGHPPDDCEKDERAVQINGIPGAICTAKCTDFLPCPKDVPKGVTAEPTCALQDSAGNHYCVLLCKPGKNKDANLRRAGDGDAGECGDATCQPAQGLGICTYDS